MNEALKGSTQIFADAITGGGVKGQGDVAKLFDMMEKGLVGNKELVKVIDYMKTLTPKDLVEAQANTVARKFERMRNQWVYFLEQTNEAGVLDVMIAAFEEATDLLRNFGKFIKENMGFFKALGSVIKTIYVSLKSVISYIYSLIKALSANQLGQSVLILTGMAGAVLLLTKYAKALNAQLLIMYARLFAIPIAVGVAIAVFVELLETLQGKDGILSALAQGDDAFSTFVAGIIMAFETVSLILKTIVGVVGGLMTGDFGFITESLEHFQNQAMKFFPNFGNFIVEGLKSFALWTSSLIDNLGNKLSKMWELAKAIGSFDFSKAGEIRAQMEDMPNLPTYSQMNPSVYRNIPQLISNNPQQNITIHAGNQNPEQIALEIRKQWDSIASISYAQSMANYGALK